MVETNCLVASISPQSPYHLLYRLFEAEAFEWVVSNETLTEYEEILTRRYSIRTAHLVLTILTAAPNTHFQEAYFKWQLVTADSDDDKFVDVAVAAGADFLVTNDYHFRPLLQLEFPKVPIISLQEFLRDFRTGFE